MHIYVASSWRNTYYPEVVQALRDAGHEVYDFRMIDHTQWKEHTFIDTTFGEIDSLLID